MSDNFAPTTDINGNIIRVTVDNKLFDVAKIPSAIPFAPDKIVLVDQISKAQFVPGQLGLNIADFSSAESIAKSVVNLGSPSTEALLTEFNVKAGMDSVTAAVTAKADAFGITKPTAAAAIASSGGTVTSNAATTFNQPRMSDIDTAPKTSELRVKLVSTVNPKDSLIFFVTPNLDESRSASYDQLNPIHHPGAMQIYRTSASRNFNINGKLIARNREEATRNIKYMNLVRSWVLPYYGTGTQKSAPDRLGAPPDVLYLTAYGDKNINKIPVVLNSYTWTYTDNIDYIPTDDGVPCPIIMDISLAMTETYSPAEFSRFDLIAFKTGSLK